jgi:hypothetical protein
MLDTDKTLNGLMGYKDESDDDAMLLRIMEKLAQMDSRDIPEDAKIEAWVDENGEVQVKVTPVGDVEE